MKVLMVGDSTVGKTTFMGATYATMADDQGYCIRCNQDESGLRYIADNLKRGVYPNSTQTRSVYDFTFRFNCEGTFFDFFNFQWLDYRGGAIFQSSDDPIANDLQKKLDEAETLVVFVDSTRLDQAMERQWFRLKQFILTFVGRACESQPLTLIIVLTKIDQFQGNLFETFIGKRVVETIDQLSNNQYLHGMFYMSSISSETLGVTFFPFIHAMRLEMAHELKRQYGQYAGRSIFGDLRAWWNGYDPELKRFEILNAFCDDINEKLKENDNKFYYLF